MKEFFGGSGFEINGMLHLSGKEACTCLLQGALLIDIREDYEIALKDFGVAEKCVCPYSEFESLASQLPVDQPLIVADCAGIKSKDIVLKLLDRGFTRVANLAGGIVEWERNGLPMKKSSETMSGQCPCMIKSRSNTRNP